MNARNHRQRVLLVRCPPDSPDARRALETATGEAGPTLCFFHGRGVNHALDPDSAWHGLASGQVRLALCSSAWRRRTGRAPPPGWSLASLAEFWDAADRAIRVECFGIAGERA